MSREHYPDFTGQKCKSYLIDPLQAETVDFAIKLGKPIVVEGEPGCGKTQLAYAIAEELLGAGQKPKIVPVKSTTRANDLLYRYNALGRLQDSQSNVPLQQERSCDVHNYIDLEFLGRAIQQGKPSVILIDEVDKADIDFADDLLHVIENFEFQVLEIPEATDNTPSDPNKPSHWVKGPENGYRPIVVFTSNHTKPLSKPFLRRCFYLELNFPNRAETLVEIVNANLNKSMALGVSNLKQVSNQLIESAVTTFMEIRTTAIEHNATKLPATAELIDWVHVLHLSGLSAEEVRQNKSRWELLFKTATDLKALSKPFSKQN